MSAGALSLPEFGLEGVDDVEDIPSASEGDSSMSFERFSHLQDLVRMGNNAFRDNRLDEAINFYIKASNAKPNDATILGNRCVSYLRFSLFLKNRSSSDSETRSLSRLDPTIHAGLALKDAEKVVSLRSSSVKSYILKANALVMLEKYELAQDVIYSGLHIDPLSIPLQNLARFINEGRRSHGKPQRSDDFDCTLCLKLLYEPITTPCGHSFCRSCLFQSMDRCNYKLIAPFHFFKFS
nr:LON peptidase N-terminal domain and RING finger protein 1-like [Ipomoea batatas]